jgi:hypothetical protein
MRSASCELDRGTHRLIRLLSLGNPDASAVSLGVVARAQRALKQRYFDRFYRH